jgi:hypothetical protein
MSKTRYETAVRHSPYLILLQNLVLALINYRSGDPDHSHRTRPGEGSGNNGNDNVHKIHDVLGFIEVSVANCE